MKNNLSNNYESLLEKRINWSSIEDEMKNKFGKDIFESWNQSASFASYHSFTQLFFNGGAKLFQRVCRYKRASFRYFGIIIDCIYIKVLAYVSIVCERWSKVGVCFVNVLLGGISKKHPLFILVDLADGNGGVVMVPFNIHLLRHGGGYIPALRMSHNFYIIFAVFRNNISNVARSFLHFVSTSFIRARSLIAPGFCEYCFAWFILSVLCLLSLS